MYLFHAVSLKLQLQGWAGSCSLGAEHHVQQFPWAELRGVPAGSL